MLWSCMGNHILGRQNANSYSTNNWEIIVFAYLDIWSDGILFYRFNGRLLQHLITISMSVFVHIYYDDDNIRYQVRCHYLDLV
jgi:hypothetical protein